MGDSGRTPRRKPVMDHAGVVANTIAYLANNHKWRSAETEITLPWTPDMKKTRRADVVAWNRHDEEFYIVECKASWADFQGDHKFMEYKGWCTYLAFAVPEELATAAKLWMEDHDGPRSYGGVGLLVIPNDIHTARRMVRKSKKRAMGEAYYPMLAHWAAACHSRLVAERWKSEELEMRWKNRNLLAKFNREREQS